MKKLISENKTQLSILSIALLNALFVFIILLPTITIAQTYPKTISLDIEDGLLQSSVWAIEEDDAGRIWIGTPSGIQVYDGFDLFSLPEIEGTILRLQKRDSSIYCITISHIYKFNSIDYSFTSVELPQSYFYISTFSDEGISLFGGEDEGLEFSYDYNLTAIQSFSSETLKSNHLFEFSLSGRKYYGGVNGLFAHDSNEIIIDAYCKHYVKYSSNRVFVASHKGLFELSIVQGELMVKRHFSDLRTSHLLVDSNKNLWVAAGDNGIFMIHRNSLKTSFYPKPIKGNKPMNCWKVSEIENQLYVCTANGLVPLKEDNWEENEIYQSTKDLAIITVVEGDGLLIIGTRSNGIYRLKNNALEQVFVNSEHELDNIIVQVEKNENGFLASSKLSLIQLDMNGDFVSQTTTDFDDVYGYTMEFYPFGDRIMNSRTTSVVELDADLKMVHNYKGDSIQVVSMMRPYQNEWWGVSLDAGLLRLEGKQLVKKRFPDKHLFTLTNWNDSSLWISGVHGIYEYSEETIRPFLSQNGFPLKEYNQNAVYKDSLGNLYYSGVGGIQQFHPDSLDYSPNPPKVLIERNDSLLAENESIELNFDQSQIVLNVRPISISNQNYFKIELRIDSFVQEIKQPKQISFDVPSGESTFQVIVTDLINKSQNIETYTIHKALPFWKKIWFVVLLVFILILLLVGGYSFAGFIKTRKKNKLAQIRIEQQQRNMSAVIKAQEDERKRIAKDLHDGIVQQLGGLHLGLQKVFADKETAETNKLVNILEESSQELRELSHKMMPRALNELGLIPALRDMLENSLGNTDIEYQFEHFGIVGRFKENVEIAIYRIAQELTNNVIKHSKASKVNVQLFKTKDSLILMIEDNGKGMGDKEQEKGIGLMNISSRLDTINGSVNFEPSPESGTLATIKIPLEND